MLTTLAVGALAALAAVQQSDTTLTVRPGDRLEVDVFAGSVTLGTWDRDAVRVTAEHGPGIELEVEREDGVVAVETTGRMGPPGHADLVVTVPRAMPIEVSGVRTSVRVSGAAGEVAVETVDGDVEVVGGTGLVALSSVQGAVAVRDARGRMELSSVNAGIHVRDASGDVTAETVNGEVILEGLDSGTVLASTVNGEIAYRGTVRPDGRYNLSTHNGGIRMTIPAGASATVSVSTFQGDFETAFPVTIPERGDDRHRKGRRFSFTLGGGGAHVDLESFQGRIELLRAGGPAAGDGR